MTSVCALANDLEMTSGVVLAAKCEANPAEEWHVLLVAYLAARDGERVGDNEP